MYLPPSSAAQCDGVSVLADCCQWVADAHVSGDPEQIVASLCEIYRLLVSRGWAPSERALILLRLHAEVVDLELSQLGFPPSEAA